jgi:hypothetical protein
MFRKLIGACVGLAVLGMAGTASATLIGSGDVVTAEFDFAGIFPGPYTSAGLNFSIGTPQFDPTDLITLQLFDDPSGAAVVEFTSTLSASPVFGFGLGAFPSAFADSAGLVVLSGFDFPVELLQLNLEVAIFPPGIASGLQPLNFVVSQAPEPSTLALFATGLALLGFLGWRRRGVVQVGAA